MKFIRIKQYGVALCIGVFFLMLVLYNKDSSVSITRTITNQGGQLNVERSQEALLNDTKRQKSRQPGTWSKKSIKHIHVEFRPSVPTKVKVTRPKNTRSSDEQLEIHQIKHKSSTKSPSPLTIPTTQPVSTHKIKTQSTVNVSRSQSNVSNSVPRVSIMLRTNGQPGFRYQFHCIIFRNLVLFWPHTFGDFVLVLDAESEYDRRFGRAVVESSKPLPQYRWKVFFEEKPNDKILVTPNFKWPGYNRQMWSTFFSDQYTTDDVIAYLDTDVMFVTPVTPRSIFNGKKLKVFGMDNSETWWTQMWMDTNQLALGLPLIADFMVTFPQYLFRDTYRKCREYIIKRLKVKTFAEAWMIFYPKGTWVSPVNILLSYAWFFERSRYDWHLKIHSSALDTINRRLPKEHWVKPEDTKFSLITAVHVPNTKKWDGSWLMPGYCQAMTAAGMRVGPCDKKHDPRRFCDFHEVVFHYKPAWESGRSDECLGHNETRVTCCADMIRRHYLDVGKLVKNQQLTLDKWKLEKVRQMALQDFVNCEPFYLP